MPSEIPIQNIYYLLCYAWDRLDQAGFVDITKVPDTELVDLFATVLLKGLEHLARRGLQTDYQSNQEELRGIRGKIDLITTYSRFLVQHGRAACIFDDLTIDNLPNQIIKSTLRVIGGTSELHSRNRLGVSAWLKKLSNVSDIAMSSGTFRKIQLNGNSRFYRFLLNVCEFVNSASLPEQQGSYRFRDFIRDEKRMALVFQHFIRNFLRIERRDLEVSAEVINWDARSESDPSLSLLPQMLTDISVVKDGRRIIIETKYYRETFAQKYGVPKLHSENLYQLFSYLVNLRSQGRQADGILLYQSQRKGSHDQSLPALARDTPGPTWISRLMYSANQLAFLQVLHQVLSLRCEDIELKIFCPTLNNCSDLLNIAVRIPNGLQPFRIFSLQIVQNRSLLNLEVRYDFGANVEGSFPAQFRNSR
jgi:5-methylcytosine-specific restriction enzyme subunit McrC